MGTMVSSLLMGNAGFISSTVSRWLYLIVLCGTHGCPSQSRSYVRTADHLELVWHPAEIIALIVIWRVYNIYDV